MMERERERKKETTSNGIWDENGKVKRKSTQKGERKEKVLIKGKRRIKGELLGGGGIMQFCTGFFSIPSSRQAPAADDQWTDQLTRDCDESDQSNQGPNGTR